MTLEQNQKNSAMTGFSTLPNELIEEIWRYIEDPYAVEAFALTSKKIYDVGTIFIHEHNTLKAKFNTVLRNPAKILRQLLLNPRAALYIEHLTLDWEEAPWDGIEDARKIGHDVQDLCRQLVQNCPFILEYEIDKWVNALDNEEMAAIYSLILTMLPNVQSLDLYRVCSSQTLLLDMIKRIAATQYAKTLSRLTEVEILQSPTLRYSGNGIDCVRTFALLPSIKGIEAVRLDEDDDSPDGCTSNSCDFDCSNTKYYEDRLMMPPKNSDLTRVHFYDCHINARGIHSFLDGMRVLESFTYSSADYPIGAMEIPEFEKIVESLCALTKHSLKLLRLVAFEASDANGSCAMSLVDLEVVKEIDIDYILIQDHKNGDRLTKTLPRSVEKVCLSHVFAQKHWTIEEDVLEMAVAKTNRLPNVRELEVELHYDNIGLELRLIAIAEQRLKDVGVALKVIRAPDGW